MSYYPLNLIPRQSSEGFFPLCSMRRLERVLKYDRVELEEIASKSGRYYRPFDSRRSEDSKEKWRHIDNPIGKLKVLQKRINTELLASISLPETMVGGIKGKSIIDNAGPHTNKPTVVCLDLKNCFPKIDNCRVYSIFKNGLGCSDEIASILTRLTTYQTRLPQGASTSQSLCNLSLLPFHNQAEKIFQAKDLSWTFYVDDVTISGKNADLALKEIAKLAILDGFAIRRKKVKIMRSGRDRQETTGLVVNKKITVSEDKIRQIRDRIVKLPDQDSVTEQEIRSIKSQIANLKRYCLVRGIHLENLLEEHAPKSIISVKRRKNPNLFRPCRHTARHNKS